jgi:hypothetical protein
MVKLRFYRDASGKSHYKILDQRGHLHVLHRPSPWSFRTNFAELIKDVLTSYLPFH